MTHQNHLIHAEFVFASCHFENPQDITGYHRAALSECGSTFVHFSPGQSQTRLGNILSNINFRSAGRCRSELGVAASLYGEGIYARSWNSSVMKMYLQ